METSDLFQANIGEWAFYISLFATFVGIVAGLRPELASLLRKWVVKLDFSPFSLVEIGYSNWGPTIGLLGSIHAIGGSQFVEKMNLTLVRLRDKKTHEFEWLVFKNESISSSRGQDITAEMATAFSIQSGEAKKLHVLLSDTATRDRFAPALVSYRDQWDDAVINDDEVRSHILAGEQYEGMAAFHAKSTKLLLETSDKIASEMYWEEGDYAITLNIRTKRPNKTFVFEGCFKLAKEEVDSLRRNKHQILFEACSMPDVNYQFANPRLKMAASSEQ